MIKIFDVFAENLKTKRIVKLNAYPRPHSQACTLMSKQTARAESRYFLQDAELDDFTQAYLRAGFQVRFKTLLARDYRRYTLHNDAPTMRAF